MINVAENVSLKPYSTMRLGGQARFCVTVTSEAELLEAIQWAADKHLPLRVIGEGSNIVWRDEGFSGLLIIMGIKSFELHEDGVVVIGAGTNWDEAVDKTVAAGLSGIEGLSYIPGTAGATPIQNVGAYGQEIANTLVSVRAYDLHQKQFVQIEKADCGFGYRTSRFKTTDSGRFVVVSITLKLSDQPPKPPFYDTLQSYLDEKQITEFTPKVIQDAVIAIRKERLPDPFETANNGSFFANPIIEQPQYEKLKMAHNDIKAWPFEGKFKISAAWLIESAGFADYHDKRTGMATWPKQALVLINESAKSTQDLLDFKQKIVSAVQAKFDIMLEQEPELLP